MSILCSVSREEAERLLLEKCAEREKNARMRYDAFFHPERIVQDSDIIVKEVIKKLIETPVADRRKGRWDEKRKLVMFCDTKSECFDDIRDCSIKMDMPFHKIKGALQSKKTYFCKKWEAEVRFKFIYD